MSSLLTGKLNKQIVNVTVCYYLLANDTERYVFYFYDPTKKEPIEKWIYYFESGKGNEFRKEFFDFIKDHNFKVNRSAILCMCNEQTKLSSIKLPKSLGFVFKYKKIIEADLMDKYGDDVKENFFIDNKVDGYEEKNAELREKRDRKKAELEKKKLQKLKTELEDKEKEKRFVPPINYTKFEKYFNTIFLLVGYLLTAFAFFVILCFSKIQNMMPILICFGVLSVLYLISFVALDLIRNKKVKSIERHKERFLVKDIFNSILIVASLGLVVFSEFIWLKHPDGGVASTLSYLYAILSSVFVIFSILWVDYKSKHRSKTYLSLPKFVKSLKREKVLDANEKEEEELFFEGVTPKETFNISHKKRSIFINKGEKTVVSFRQLLVSQYSYKSASFIMKLLGLKVREIRTLPSLINQFHLKYAKGVNEIVVYNEADFSCFVGIVNDKIVDSVFVKGSEKAKEKDGKTRTFHLQSFYNVFSSLLFACQRENVRMDRVLYFSNSKKKIEQFKEENVYGLPNVIVQSTDAIFGKSSKSIKEQAQRAFTIIETVVAFTIFMLTGLVVSTLSIAVSNMNRFTTDQGKANVYVNNVREVLRDDPSKVEYITYKNFSNGESIACEYYVNYDFDISSRSLSQGDNFYKVVASIYEYDYEGFSTYRFTFKSITRASNERNLIEETVIEVTKK